MSAYLNEDEIRARVRQKMARRRRFMAHLVTYIVVNGVLWLGWLTTLWTMRQMGGFDFDSWPFSMMRIPWPLVVMVFWGIFLLAHGIRAYQQTTAQEREDLAVQREIERERKRLGEAAFEKPKRHASLSDDGELVFEEEHREEPARQRKQAK